MKKSIVVVTTEIPPRLPVPSTQVPVYSPAMQVPEASPGLPCSTPGCSKNKVDNGKHCARCSQKHKSAYMKYKNTSQNKSQEDFKLDKTASVEELLSSYHKLVLTCERRISHNTSAFSLPDKGHYIYLSCLGKLLLKYEKEFEQKITTESTKLSKLKQRSQKVKEKIDQDHPPGGLGARFVGAIFRSALFPEKDPRNLGDESVKISGAQETDVSALPN